MLIIFSRCSIQQTSERPENGRMLCPIRRCRMPRKIESKSRIPDFRYQNNLRTFIEDLVYRMEYDERFITEFAALLITLVSIDGSDVCNDALRVLFATSQEFNSAEEAWADSIRQTMLSVAARRP